MKEQTPSLKRYALRYLQAPTQAFAGQAAEIELEMLADGAAPITPPVDWDALSAQLDAAEIEPVPAGDDPLQPRLF